jgi:HK97 family phage portal protein
MFNRLWTGLKAAGHAFKTTVRTFNLSSSRGFWSGFKAEWTNATYRNIAQMAIRNPTVHRGVNEIKNRVQSVFKHVQPVRDTEGGGVTEVDDHPVLRLLDQPNSRNPFSYLLAGMTWQWWAAGEFFLRAWSPSTGPSRRQYPRRLQLFRASDFAGFEFDPQSGFPEGYHLRLPNDKTELFGRDEIIHARNYNPLPRHRFRGLPILIGVLRKLDLQQAQDKWNKSVSSSGGRAPFFLMPKGLEPGDFLSEEKRDQTQEKIEKQYEGAATDSMPWVLSGMFEVIESAHTPEEARIREGYDQDTKELAKGMGLSPVLLGSTDGATYDNLETSEYQAYRGVVLPFVDRILDELNRHIMPRFANARDRWDDVYLHYNRRSINALDVAMKNKVEALSKLVSSGTISRDEARSETGWPERGGDAGTLYAPGNMIAIDQAGSREVGSPERPELTPEMDDLMGRWANMSSGAVEKEIDELFSFESNGHA